MNYLLRSKKLLILPILIIVVLISTGFKHAQAIVVPPAVQSVYLSYCPLAPPYTVHGVYADPSTFTSGTTTVAVPLYAASVICAGAGYNSVASITIAVNNITLASKPVGCATTPNMVFTATGLKTYTFGTFGLLGQGIFNGVGPQGTTVTSLCTGTTVFTVDFCVVASNGTGCGSWNVVINFTQLIDTSPTISVSNPSCASTTFTITSHDVDGNGYTARWRIRQNIGGVWQAWSAWSANIGGFGGTVTVALPAYNILYAQQIQADTGGYVRPGSIAKPRVSDASNPWGPCAQGFDFRPQAPVTISPSVYGYYENPTTASFNPKIINFGADKVNNISWQTSFYIKYLSGAPNTDLNCAPVNGTINMPITDYTFVPCNKPLPQLSAGDQICSNLAINPGTGKYDPRTNNWIAGTTASRNSGATCSFISDLPFAKFYGSDIFAGGSFKNVGTCADNPAALISTFYNNSNNAGSSVQFAATAMSFILNFTSANLGSVAPDVPPTGLSFSNTAAVVPPSFLGGSFGGSNCITDYWKTLNSSATVIPGANINLGAGAYAASGLYLANAGGTIDINDGGGMGAITSPDGSHRIFYIDGNAHISNDILSQDEKAGWASEDQIPILYIIVKGDIYIDPGVSEINGIFIAQERSPGVGGTIYTCATASGPYLNPKTLDASHFLPGGDCNNNKLVVNGTFIAQHVKLLRTAKSLRDSNFGTGNNENAYYPWFGFQASAESFQFTPENYVTNICNDLPSVCSSGSQDDSITALPPIL